MPTINKIERKPRSQRTDNSPSRQLRREAYNRTEWRKLRNIFIQQHPLCEECLKRGKVTPASDIHHIRSPFQGGEINDALLMDENNLMALCKDCHGALHGGRQESPEEIIDRLDLLLNGNTGDNK